MKGKVLVIAGSDSGGGAGIQADIKTITSLGGYAMTALTALTAQNTLGVHAVHEVPLDFIEKQIRVCLDDLGADAIKTGMLNSAKVIERIVTVLADYPSIPIICDPVMRAKGGAPLLEEDAQSALKELLLPRSYAITPNVPEAEALSGMRIETPTDLTRAGKVLCKIGCQLALMKGGHLTTPTMTDLLVSRKTAQTLSTGRERSLSRHTHGTGCTLAAALAIGVAQGLDAYSAANQAVEYVASAMQNAPGFGKGHGPLNHAWKYAPKVLS
ncbi:MAG: bifunctional hydroxymethylpyrimidine kinase/phosphomethylpyrimidine kinase [Alphaproteobacteria bacterium]